jgi:hypothetical protein
VTFDDVAIRIGSGRAARFIDLAREMAPAWLSQPRDPRALPELRAALVRQRARATLSAPPNMKAPRIAVECPGEVQKNA